MRPQLELHEVVLHRLRSSPPRPSPGTPRRSRGVPGLGRGGLELKLYEVATEDSTQVNQGYVQVHRGVAEVYLDLAAVYLSLSCTRRIASTSRRSRDVLTFLRVQLLCNGDEEEGKYTKAQPRCTCPSSESALHWSLVATAYNFRALLMRRRQVQRGVAELYLPSYRINNA